jgi:hypothetical protein
MYAPGIVFRKVITYKLELYSTKFIGSIIRKHELHVGEQANLISIRPRLESFWIVFFSKPLSRVLTGNLKPFVLLYLL